MWKSLLIGVLWLVMWAPMAGAETLSVGVKPVPPFAMQDEQGQWVGISVELWQSLADELGWETRWVALDSVDAQVEALAEGQIDVAVGALSMTADREALFDFSHPFYATGLAIATTSRSGGILGALKPFASTAFLGAVGLLAALLFAVGALLWFVEHKRNPEQFGGNLAKGLGNGFWWSAVTMTTVGYGDKAPVTTAGRFLATVWMFFSVITISSFTAAIASSVTLNQLSTAVHGVEDLDRVRVLAVSGSTGESFLKSQRIGAEPIARPEEGLAALRRGDAEALVYDEAILRYLLRDSADGVELLPQRLDRQDYAFGVRDGFGQLEALNRSLLAITRSEQWQDTLTRYLGAP